MLNLGWDSARALCSTACLYRFECFRKIRRGRGSQNQLRDCEDDSADPVLMGKSWQVLRIFYSILDIDKFSRTFAEASSCNGQRLRNRPQ